MRIGIENVGDLIRELEKYPPYMRIFKDEGGEQFHDIAYEKDIPIIVLRPKQSSDLKDWFDKTEGLILK